MSKVYLVQMPKRRNIVTGRMEDARDISSASEYGEITQPLFPRFGASYFTQTDVHEVRKQLRDFGDDDCLLLLGDPAAIGLAVSLAAEVNRGCYSVLRWDRDRRQYMKLSFNLRS